MNQLTGTLSKMNNHLDGEQVYYQLPLGPYSLDMNSLVGHEVSIHFTGKIACQYCGCAIKKSYQQGYCFLATRKLARCDMCILKPEQCHHHHGTCREPQWGERHCMQPHYVYLANASGLKVGITRQENIPHRWVDQGAVQALPIIKVATRRLSGLVEVALKHHISDKTDWRKMLKNQAVMMDLVAERDRLLTDIAPALQSLQADFGADQISHCDTPALVLRYPVLQYPEKVSALNLDKTPNYQGILQGIKGQYWLIGDKVINIRKFSGYEVSISSHQPLTYDTIDVVKTAAHCPFAAS